MSNGVEKITAAERKKQKKNWLIGLYEYKKTLIKNEQDKTSQK